MAWAVGVEVPDDLAERGLLVMQGEGNHLEEDQVHELCWPLMDPLGSVTVRWSDETSTEAERCFEASPFRVFKIARSGVKGWAVSRVTHGSYIVVAPRVLTRDETVGGSVPVAPENVIPEQAGMLAHHLLVGAETDVLALGQDGTRRVEIRPFAAGAYEFLGHRIEDAHDVAGPLFGREPPHLQVKGAEEPAQVVVGLEGPSPRRRRRQTAASFEDARPWFEEHEPDWFFVRLYDANDELLDSLDFRYVRDLEAIEIDGNVSLPGPRGHRPARVRFHLASEVTISPVDGPPEITSLRNVPAESALLPARPDAGQATWRLRAGKGGGVDVTVCVPRVWWAFAAEERQDAPPAWTDRPQKLAVEHFRPTSSMLLSVLLPAPGWADEMIVAFRGGVPRRIRVPRSERTVTYPLRNLGEVDAPCEEETQDLVMWLGSRTGELGPVIVGEVRPTQRQSQEPVAQPSLDLSALSPPRLMRVITRLGCAGPVQDRRPVRRLRALYYQRARTGGPAETREFLRQGLALVAALVERASGTSPLPARWRPRAALLAALEPAMVAAWKRILRELGPSRRVKTGRSAWPGDSPT